MTPLPPRDLFSHSPLKRAALCVLFALLLACDPRPSTPPPSPSAVNTIDLPVLQVDTAPSTLATAAQAAAEVVPGEMIKTVQALQRQALDGQGAYDFLDDLTTEVGPRFAGTDGDRRGVAWAVNRLNALGFENVRTEAVEVPRWIRGMASGEILTPFPHPTVLVALGGSVGTVGPIEAEIVEVPSLEGIQSFSREQIEGKIVFFNQRMRRSQDAAGYGETVGIRVAGASVAAKLGAVAVLIRSVGTDNDRVGHTGTMRYLDDAPRIPAAALSIPDANVLEKQLARGEAVTFRLNMNPRYEDTALSANVIGEVLGREHPDEIVLLMAHLDSWDLGTGAVDNGSGCAIISEAARLIGALPTAPRRTIRVVLTANEEFGLSGARAYAEAHADEIDQHIAGFESDLGASPVWAMRSRVADGLMPRMKAWAALLEPLGIVYAGNEARGGADLSPLRPLGLPVFDLRQDARRYFDLHHTINDTFDQVDAAELAQNVAAYVSLIYLAAESEDDLGRAPVPES